MKCEFKTDYEDKKSFAWSLTISLMLIVISCNALTSDNPYSTIFSRNVFALKPPQPVLPPTIALVVVPAGIDLQGFTTILGRPQVLLKVKIPPRPPEPAKDQFMVMDVGQREGDVEVLEIDAYAGVVKIRNQGNLLTLTLKENGLKPAEGPAIPVAANLGVPKIPGFAPSNIPSVNGNVNAAPSLGVPQSQSLPPAPSLPSIPVVPTRPIRAGVSGQPGQAEPLSALQQAAIMEVERVRTKDLVRQGKYPPLPPIPGVTPPESNQ